MLFGLVPLAIAWWQIAQSNSDRKHALRTSFLSGWMAQFVLNLIGFHWIADTATEFGHFPRWAGILTLIGFAAIAHLYYALAGVAAVLADRLLRERRGVELSPAAFTAFAFSAFAFFEAIWPSIFPWHLGYTWLWAELPGAQFADLIGFEGLNLVTLAANALFAIGAIRWFSTPGPRRERLTYATVQWPVAALLLFLAVNWLGAGREKPWQNSDRELHTILVQGNIGNYEKLIVEKKKDFAVPIIETYMRLSAKALEQFPQADTLLWPETAFPDYLDQEYSGETNWKSLRGFAAINKKTVLTGAYSHDSQIKTSYNGFFAMSDQGQLIGPPHRKSILIPFGEKFPFSDIIPYMKWLFPGLGSFGGGPGPMTMQLANFRLGPQICLESLYPKFSAELARLGAEIISNVTNDSWFGRTFEPHQHMMMTLARAVENRRPLLRVTNTGISTVILADGTVLDRSPIGAEWAGYYRVPYKYNPPVVLYSKIAGYTHWLSLFSLLAIVGAAVLTQRKNPSKTHA